MRVLPTSVKQGVLGLFAALVLAVPLAPAALALSSTTGDIKGTATYQGTACLTGSDYWLVKAGTTIDTSTPKKALTLSLSGAFTISNVPPGNYDLQIGCRISCGT